MAKKKKFILHECPKFTFLPLNNLMLRFKIFQQAFIYLVFLSLNTVIRII